ncbi:MAG: methylated-DNA--[protein]-cysteine S-methyltransferase [Actinobacteria bacterium]|uniref:methylated-DNA--[protein]-cysteine S-methyltransferase n=1 Tax=freshwater metagenome TaxID=449393 RepID=A0A6J6LMT3_9ZZZZ|nr:methylated-DNA--[protein]-cysteine S-methyltransferase [Actinomycetota bacterium]MSW47097.1 methylated-DNA--[protein]-cysteine S-methyltransferase [Actinomycetota bacterium]MSX24584.1 methylated-DNA--[protein]-cysteine S-methyltransferase [Actinomycetota bacterium]MSY46375.1 methylated-DNA--[protein]-cysteine S-methyltransferase [Actinomycetota bacterium]MSY56969.1 methylated-DNA--[protein]-cysteine S-methyltransferase [Actinomycetota bacterium]
MALLTTSFKTPIGTLHLVADEHILVSASFNESAIADEAVRVKRVPIISELLNDYFDGDLNAINAIAVRQAGPTFSQSAWKAMRKIKPGKVLSYTDLAVRAGSASAVRAAGSACAKNAIVIVVPCHRIVKTGGALGNYAYGLNAKEWLLRHEGAI